MDADALTPGQPYFFVGVHDANKASAMIATAGAIRRIFENTCINTLF